MNNEPDFMMVGLCDLMRAMCNIPEGQACEAPMVTYRVQITETITKTTEVEVSMPSGSYFEAVDKVRSLHERGKITAASKEERTVDYENLGSDDEEY